MAHIRRITDGHTARRRDRRPIAKRHPLRRRTRHRSLRPESDSVIARRHSRRIRRRIFDHLAPDGNRTKPIRRRRASRPGRRPIADGRRVIRIRLGRSPQSRRNRTGRRRRRTGRQGGTAGSIGTCAYRCRCGTGSTCIVPGSQCTACCSICTVAQRCRIILRSSRRRTYSRRISRRTGAIA